MKLKKSIYTNTYNYICQSLYSWKQKHFQTSVLKLYVYKTVFLSAVETKNTFVKVKLMQIVLMLWGSKKYFQWIQFHVCKTKNENK